MLPAIFQRLQHAPWCSSMEHASCSKLSKENCLLPENKTPAALPAACCHGASDTAFDKATPSSCSQKGDAAHRGWLRTTVACRDAHLPRARVRRHLPKPLLRVPASPAWR